MQKQPAIIRLLEVLFVVMVATTMFLPTGLSFDFTLLPSPYNKGIPVTIDFLLLITVLYTIVLLVGACGLFFGKNWGKLLCLVVLWIHLSLESISIIGRIATFIKWYPHYQIDQNIIFAICSVLIDAPAIFSLNRPAVKFFFQSPKISELSANP